MKRNIIDMIIKFWLSVALFIMFVVTLPLMVVVAPAVVAWEVAGNILNKNKAKKVNNSFSPSDLLIKWSTAAENNKYDWFGE